MVSVDVKHHVLFLTSDSLLRYTVAHVVGPVYIPWAHSTGAKFQALVYDIRPPTTAITDYAIGLEKLSANGQFFVGTQIAVSL